MIAHPENIQATETDRPANIGGHGGVARSRSLLRDLQSAVANRLVPEYEMGSVLAIAEDCATDEDGRVRIRAGQLKLAALQFFREILLDNIKQGQLESGDPTENLNLRVFQVAFDRRG